MELLMGDDFIFEQTQAYRRQAEKVHEQEFNQSGVFTVVPEETSYVFRFKAPNANPQVGDEIWLADLPGKDGVRVLFGTITIGEVDAAGSTKLRKLMGGGDDGGGVLPGVVVSQKDIAGYAKAKVSL